MGVSFCQFCLLSIIACCALFVSADQEHSYPIARHQKASKLILEYKNDFLIGTKVLQQRNHCAALAQLVFSVCIGMNPAKSFSALLLIILLVDRMIFQAGFQAICEHLVSCLQANAYVHNVSTLSIVAIFQQVSMRFQSPVLPS